MSVVSSATEQNGTALQFACEQLRGDMTYRKLAETSSSIFPLISTALANDSSQSPPHSPRRRPRESSTLCSDGRWPACKDWSPDGFLRQFGLGQQKRRGRSRKTKDALRQTSKAGSSRILLWSAGKDAEMRRPHTAIL